MEADRDASDPGEQTDGAMQPDSPSPREDERGSQYEAHERHTDGGTDAEQTKVKAPQEPGRDR